MTLLDEPFKSLGEQGTGDPPLVHLNVLVMNKEELRQLFATGRRSLSARHGIPVSGSCKRYPVNHRLRCGEAG